MRHQGSTRYERNLVDQIRTAMAAGNPVPVRARAEADRPEAQERVVTLHLAAGPGPQARYPDREATAGRRRTWRLVAPAAAALAVIALIAGLTLAAGSGPGRTAAGAPAAGTSAQGMPRYYVTNPARPPRPPAGRHDSLTGRPLSWVAIPGRVAPSITAAHNDRVFVIDAVRIFPHREPATVLYLLRVTAGGRRATLTRLPVRATSPGSADLVDGLALSPDGARLAVALQVPTTGFHPRGEIVVFSLTGGPARTWTAPGDNALPWDPAWTGSEQLSFLWQDHIRGPATNFTARTQVRVLDTAAPGRNVLSARVLAAGGGKLGFIQTAFAAPRRGPIIASAFRNSPAAGRSGTATVRLVALSARTGQVIKVLAARTVRYRGLRQQNQADGSCQVLGLDATGQHALVDCPGFSRLDHGRLTRLPGPGVLAAAW
jgi:hypothetical protein